MNLTTSIAVVIILGVFYAVSKIEGLKSKIYMLELEKLSLNNKVDLLQEKNDYLETSILVTNNRENKNEYQ